MDPGIPCQFRVKRKSKHIFFPCSYDHLIILSEDLHFFPHFVIPGARMKMALNGVSNPLKSINVSNDSLWRPNAFLFTWISMIPSSGCPVFSTCSSPFLARRTSPAHVPMIGIRQKLYSLFRKRSLPCQEQAKCCTFSPWYDECIA